MSASKAKGVPPSADKKSTTRRVSASLLEADLAYFEARLELVGQPRTLNQQAQQAVFSALERITRARLSKLSGKQHAARTSDKSAEQKG